MLQNKNKRSRASNPPVCPYCKSTFASGNNLRRHIVEVHKRNEAKQMRENGAAETQFIEKECECQACGITFSNRSEWVEHKITHARTMKPSTTYEWGCDICGKIFTRKERLLVHMLSHMNNEDEKLGARKSDGFESNSQSSMSSQSQSHQSRSQQSMDSNNVKSEPGGKLTVSLLKQPQSLLKQQQTTQNKSLIVPKTEQGEEKKIIMKLSVPSKVDFDAEDSNSSNEAADQPISCDICQGHFKSSHELRQHIKSHIHDKGPEMDLNEDVRDSDLDSDGEEDYGDYDDHELEQNDEKQHEKADESDSDEEADNDDDISENNDEYVDEQFDEDDEEQYANENTADPQYSQDDNEDFYDDEENDVEENVDAEEEMEEEEDEAVESDEN